MYQTPVSDGHNVARARTAGKQLSSAPAAGGGASARRAGGAVLLVRRSAVCVRVLRSCGCGWRCCFSSEGARRATVVRAAAQTAMRSSARHEPLFGD